MKLPLHSLQSHLYRKRKPAFFQKPQPVQRVLALPLSSKLTSGKPLPVLYLCLLICTVGMITLTSLGEWGHEMR